MLQTCKHDIAKSIFQKVLIKLLIFQKVLIKLLIFQKVLIKTF